MTVDRTGMGRRRLLPYAILTAALLTSSNQISKSQESFPQLVQRHVHHNDDSPPLRLATWNIRWFPRGCPDAAKCPSAATDLDLVTQTIATESLDLVALQEIVYDEDGQEAISRLISSLDSLSGGQWGVDVQACGAPENQRVGFLWNSARLTLTDFADLEQLNGGSENGGGACAENLRPGRYAYARSADGKVDFHVVTVHFDSGRRDRDYQNRRDATRQIPHLKLADKKLQDLDTDVIILGDFNTMGRGEPTEITAPMELEEFDREIGPGFRRVSVVAGCSQYYRGRAGLLDFFVLSESLASTALVSKAGSFCADNTCRDLDENNMPAAYERVSDHCPVILELDKEGS